MDTVRERSLRLAGGAHTTVQQWGEHGPLVVGVHGLGSSRRGWARIGERLGGQYRVVAFDQRGHGDSDVRGPMTFEQSVADLGVVVASLGEPVRALIGHSWGGAVVIAGGRALGEVACVVAVDPMLRVEAGVWNAQTLPEYRRQLAPPLDEREAAVRRSLAALPEIEIASKLHATRRLAIETVEALGIDNDIDAGRWDLRELVASYPKPLLLALADPKRSVVSHTERDEFRASGGDHVHIEVFAGAGHSLQRDAFDRVMPVVEAFLAV